MTDRVSEHFNRREFACKCGCGMAAVDIELLDLLETLRAEFNKKYTNARVEIRSGCRCEKHNAVTPSAAKGSFHPKGMAADFLVRYTNEDGVKKKVPADEVADYLEEAYPEMYGVGRYRGRTHVDVGPFRRWDKRGENV